MIPANPTVIRVRNDRRPSSTRRAVPSPKSLVQGPGSKVGLLGTRDSGLGTDCSVDKLVPNPPDRLDPGLAAADLLAQPGHVHVHRPSISVVVVPPAELQQPLPLEDHPRLARQRRQYLE